MRLTITTTVQVKPTFMLLTRKQKNPTRRKSFLQLVYGGEDWTTLCHSYELWLDSGAEMNMITPTLAESL